MVTSIPLELRRHGLRFVKVLPNKLPIEKGYQKDANYVWNDPQLLSWLAQNNGYGVLCGKNNLTVVDFDDRETEETILPLIPETLNVRTPNKGRIHAYYFMPDGGETYRIKSADGKTSLLDIQGTGKYVLAPNSPHQNGGKYLVSHDTEIATWKLEELKRILREKGLFRNVEAFETTKNNGKNYNALHEIPIRTLTEKLGVVLSGNRGVCPFCNDPNPSFVVLSNTSACCFACPEKPAGKQAKGWSSITFYRQAKAAGLL